MRKLLCIVLFFAFMLLGLEAVLAQSRINVSGRLLNKEGAPVKSAYVFAFATVAEGDYEFKRAKELHEAKLDYIPELPHLYVMTSDDDGSYEISANPSGTLIFYKPGCAPVRVDINYKRRHSPTMDASIELDAGGITAERGKVTKKGKTIVVGNRYYVKDAPYFFKKEMLGEVERAGKTNARMVAQMFLTNKSGTDTLWYHVPRVRVGEQFMKTQDLWGRDPLCGLADKNVFLNNAEDSLTFNHSFELVEPDEDYYCKAHIWIEDYIKVYYKDTVELLNTGRVSRPFQFLEYSFEYGQLDHEEFKKKAKKEFVPGSRNMKLKFKVGSSQLDISDKETATSLDSLKSELRQICTDPASELIDINFYGFSSPEGNHAKNVTLSEQRTTTVKNDVLSSLPRGIKTSNFGRNSKGEVASWGEVADILEADSLVSEAAEVRKIINAIPKDITAQGAKIRTLSYYRSLIAPRLEQLRVVRCEYKTIVDRALTPEEIWGRYQEDPEFKTGKYNFSLNDYWHLFVMVKDKQELERLYRRALKTSWDTEREYWMLPANHLAVMLLERKQVDTTLLAPFISDKYGLNATPTNEDGVKKKVNWAPVVMNQVQMFMLAKNYERAEELSSLLETENPILRAVVRCLGGYMDPNDERDKQRIELICESSPRNRAIINMYHEVYDTTTAKILNGLPKDDPVIMYLKAQRLCLENSNQSTRMQASYFNRSDDPGFEHPLDAWTPHATKEQIADQRKVVKQWEAKYKEYRKEGYTHTRAYCKEMLDEALIKLDKMKKGEDRVLKLYDGPISSYEAARTYLVRCFETDKKYIDIAKRDADINEDLYNDIMGIKKEENK